MVHRHAKRQPRPAAEEPKREQPDYAVQSVGRALDLLEVFLAHESELTLTQVAAASKMNKGTAHRVLSTLEARGYVQRSPYTRKYGLGIRVFDLGARFQNQLDIRRAAMPEMTSLVEQTGQSAFLCMRDGDFALCLERVEGRHRVRIFALRVGERQHLHCGAAPRALLSGMSDAEILAYAARTGLPGFTPKTITKADQLLQDIHCAREQGWTLSNEDVSPGIAAIGAPVRARSGNVVASISVSGISTIYTPERIAELAEAVKSAAWRLSQQIV